MNLTWVKGPDQICCKMDSDLKFEPTIDYDQSHDNHLGSSIKFL